MDTKAAANAPAPDPVKLQTSTQPAAQTREPEPAPKPKPETPPASDQVEMRLVIEMDQASGSYVYKTINRLTGEVVSQLPRAEVLRMRDGADYESGTVIRTKA
jgi:flagellar protein FlaG